METKLNYKRTFLIGLAFLSICSFWQMYDNIIPLILQNTYHLGETMTGAVMALDNVLAIFLLPVFGTLSDKVHTKLGRRMPFIVSGTILAVIFMMLLPMIDNAEKARWGTVESFSNQVIFLAVLFFTMVSMGLYRSPAVALMPDVIESEEGPAMGGEQITLEVSDRIYGELQEGDCASLSYRDEKLISFGALQNRDDRERSFRR